MTVSVRSSPSSGFRHEAMLYAGSHQFIDRTLPFIQEGVRADEAVLVVVSEPKIGLLKDRLGSDAGSVSFAVMEEIGANPARIIPAWQDFVETGLERKQGMRGIGEPIWPSRTPSELAECHHHEALLNRAFASVPRFWLMCPYDTGTLQPDVIEHLARTHPVVDSGLGGVASPSYDEARARQEPFTDPLPPPAPSFHELRYAKESLGRLRRWVRGHALSAGLDEEARQDLVLAAAEVATNSVLHGGGSGRARLWIDDRDLVCEFTDRGHITEPLVGRVLPRSALAHGRGLWMVNQLCDLVQIRSTRGQTVVRLHKFIGGVEGQRDGNAAIG